MLKRVHFVGIGGIGMCGIAEVLLSRKIEVQGSDLFPSENTSRLIKLGANIFFGHHKEQVNQADIVVTSTAIRENNPEVVEAKALGIPVIKRARMLAELMRLQQGIAVSGAHGKTTTTSLVACILEEAKLDPTVVIGGKVNQMGTTAKLGQGKFLVAEADESDGSFQELLPNIAVITNIDAEHLYYWTGGLPEIKQAFVSFLNKLPFFGAAIMCVDDVNIREILPRLERRVISYGIDKPADLMAKNIRYDNNFMLYNLFVSEEDKGEVKINLLGEHNVQNSLAAIAVALEIDISLEIIKQALEKFEGIQRRFTKVGEKNGILIIDDYAHHPVEIEAVLKTAKKAFKNKNLIVLFEPHKYSRTLDLMADFAKCFKDASKVIVSDTYPAGESPIKGSESSCLVEQINAHEGSYTEAIYGGDLDSSVKTLAKSLETNDVLLTLGAGKVTCSAREIFELI